MNSSDLNLMKRDNQRKYMGRAAANASRSGQRIISNRLRRMPYRNILLTSASLCLAVVISLGSNGFLSNAETADGKQPEAKYYTSILIQNGDTLWKFAQEYMGDHYESESAYVREVMKINSLKEEKIIAGQHLVIPYFCAAKAEE